MTATEPMLKLARGMQQRRVNAASEPSRREGPHSCGVDRHDDIWRAGYVAGVCAAVAATIGERSVDIEKRVEAEIGCPIDAAAKVPSSC